MEVVEVEDLHTSPVPPKAMSSLRHTRSEENIAGSNDNVVDRSSNCGAFSIYSSPDEETTGDCWSQEDDEISQQVSPLFHFISVISTISLKSCCFSISLCFILYLISFHL